MLDSVMLEAGEASSFTPKSRITDQWGKFFVRSMTTEAILKIGKLNLDQVMAKLIKEGWTMKRYLKAERLYRQFLKLMVLEPQAQLVPTHDIDEVWHAHILFTKKYHQDCQDIFDHYIHHSPSEDDGELAEAFDEMARLFKFHFNENVVGPTPCRHGGCNARCKGCSGQK